MGMETSEILFTRQRHEAKRAGLHYDIRLVHGDVAYSWATKLDMPKPGETIILHQQPIHDSAYALSKKVVIPDGQYGAGITHLDFVRKAQLKKSDDGSYFTITAKGEKYLLKHIPNYGENQWIFKNLTPYKEGPKSTVTHEGKSYKVDDLLAKAKDITSKKYNVKDLDWIFDKAQSKHTEVDPKRVDAANTQFPLLISKTKDGKLVVVDGTHRLAKIIREGGTEVRAKYIEKLAAEEKERPHTLRALKKLEDQKALLVDHSMGSGKTRLYLKAIEAHQKKNPKDNVLIMAPASLTSNVYKEIKKHGINIDMSHLETLSYEKAAIDADRLKKKVYGMVVADEAHKLRNTDTKRHKELSEIITNADKRLLGTGTSAYNHPADVATLVNLVAGKKVLPEKRKDFEDEYIDKIVEQPPLLKRILGHPAKEIQKLKNKKRLEKILRKHIDFYDLKDDPDSKDDFPTKVETVKEVQMSPEQHTLYRYMEGKLPFHLRFKVRMNMPLDKKDVASLQAFATGIRQVSNSTRSFMPKYDKPVPKIQAAVESLHQSYKTDKNFRGLVYSNYLGSGLEDYSKELYKRGIPHTVYHGGLSKVQKDQALEQYNSGVTPVMLLSSSGAEGLNTKGTKKIQILEPHYNKSKIDQVVARGVRYKSHDHLPKAERKVEVEHYLSTLPQRGWSLGPKAHSIDQYLHHNAKTKSSITDEMKELVKEAEEANPMIKEALNAFKARSMARAVGVIADHTTQWKYAVRKLRSGDGKALTGDKLEKAKAQLGAIHKDDFKKIVEHQSKHPGREIGAALDRDGKLSKGLNGRFVEGTSHEVNLTHNPTRGERTMHTHPETSEHSGGGDHRVTHASGLADHELPFKKRTWIEALGDHKKARKILNNHDIPSEQVRPLLKKHTKGLVGMYNQDTRSVRTGGIHSNGADIASSITSGKQNDYVSGSMHNIVSAHHGVDAAHKTHGIIHNDGMVLATKHRTVMFKHAEQSAIMVKCEDLLTDLCMQKAAFFERPEHSYVRAKYKESLDYSHVKDPVGSVKWDGAAFFMEIGPDGSPRFLSRRESVKGGFPDRTPNLMYLGAKKVPEFAGNAYHVELIHTGHDYHEDILDSHPTVSGILNSKPARALATQAEIGPVRAVLLDVIHPKIDTYGEKLEHLKQVKAAFGDVPNLHISNIKIGKEEIDKLVSDTKKQGREGVVVTSLTAPEDKNVRVKIKHVDTYNLKIVGIIQERDILGNPKESMGALEVADATGRIVAKVGTGFTRKMREDIWNNKDDYMNTDIQVKAMPTTSSRLRAPVYNGLADGDLDTVNERFTT